jgi:hypothetical protein
VVAIDGFLRSTEHHQTKTGRLFAAGRFDRLDRVIYGQILIERTR